MARVAITESYLEDIADAIRAKNSSETLYKPSEMSAAILALPAGGGIIPTGTKSITTNGTHDVYNYAYADVSVSSTINNQDKTVNPSTSQQSITADSGYSGLGTVTVNAMPSGTAGTPTATKGTVSSNSISVTPSVTNTTGYITGGTKTGTAVTVSASELVSGNKPISSNGTGIDVTNYATVSVNVSGGSSTDFIVTLSWDAQQEMWVPNYTYSRLAEEYDDGKTIIFVADNDEATANGQFRSQDHLFIYYVRWLNLDEYDNYFVIDDTYILSQNSGLELDERLDYRYVNNEDKTVTPSESQQTVTFDPSEGYSGLGTVTVSAISSTYVGSGITRRDSSDLSALGATITAPAGYYANSASASVSSMTLPTSASSSATSGYTSKATISRSTSDQYINIPTGYNSAGAYYKINAVANGSATGPSSITQSGATVSTGTNTLTLTKTNVSTTPTVSAGYVASATSSTATVALTANVTTKAAATITPGTSDQTIASGTYLTGTQTISGDADLIAGNIKKDVSIFGVTGTYEGGGGGSSMTVATTTKTLTSASSSIQFTGLSGQPTSFAIRSSADQSTGGTKVVAVAYDGTSCHGIDITTQAADDTGFTQSYSNGTLTVTATTASFQANEYSLVYSYNGSAANIGTADVQVGSGATSITFTGLEDEPEYFSCIFKSTFSTSSGYQRVMDVVYDGTSTYGNALDSSAKALTSWSYTYNNGSLTISSTGTNNGGYFHQPGYYQLTYAVGGDSTLQKKTVTPTSSDQTITADTAQGYTALSQVKVEGVVCENLIAGNIKSGVTVKIGTDTDDDSVTSVVGTYTGGGGTSKNVQTAQSTTRRANTSLGSINSLTCSTTGTYDVYWTCARSNTSQTWGSQLYIGGTAYGSENTTWSNNVQNNHLTGVSISANQTVAVYGRSRGSSYYIYAPQLTIVQTS